MGWVDGLISGDDIKKNMMSRSRKYYTETISKSLTAEYEAKGWSLDKEFKTKNRMRMDKPQGVQFEDEVWLLLASLGFKTLNRDRNLKIPYAPNNDQLTKQIDVFAIDDETILVVECKCSEKMRRGSFKTEIEAIEGYKRGLTQEIRNKFPDLQADKKRKIKFVLATKNYNVSTNDLDRLKECKILHLDSKTIRYYLELVKHLGVAARYQFLGMLFGGEEVKAMENRIPAIKGKMGGNTYYSFTIEPEKLLKISYVLHRSEANDEMMPTYQRLIKKQRLKQIQEFVNNGGFFPNSIIVSLDTRGKPLQFDQAPKELKGDSDRTNIGILHLPQRYRTAYIIDGQHRLYGYSDTKYGESDQIPVVAFENLGKAEQLRLFMQINENQKSIPKSLRSTLNADLLWDDPILNRQMLALRQQIAIRFGEDPDSPYHQQIKIGENVGSKNTEFSLISIEAIENAINATDFLTKYDKNNIIEKSGTFDRGDKDTTLRNLYAFLQLCFTYIINGVAEEYDRTTENFGILYTNNTVYALIRVFGDIVNHLINNNLLNTPISNSEEAYNASTYYLDSLISYYRGLSAEEIQEIKKYYGSGGRISVWRIVQRAINSERNEFNPAGLSEWIRDNTRQYITASFKMINEIEEYLKSNFRNVLSDHYGDSWFTRGVPRKVYTDATSLASSKDYDAGQREHTTDPWDCITLINYREIATYGSNWRDIFEERLTRPDEKRISGGKDAKTKWMQKLNSIRNKSHHNNPVSEDEYSFLTELYDWLIKKDS